MVKPTRQAVSEGTNESTSFKTEMSDFSLSAVSFSGSTSQYLNLSTFSPDVPVSASDLRLPTSGLSVSAFCLTPQHLNASTSQHFSPDVSFSGSTSQ
jgi:hypothetical protein